MSVIVVFCGPWVHESLTNGCSTGDQIKTTTNLETLFYHKQQELSLEHVSAINCWKILYFQNDLQADIWVHDVITVQETKKIITKLKKQFSHENFDLFKL